MKKKSWKAIKLAKRISLGVGIFILFVLFMGCAALRMDFAKADKKLTKKFQKKSVPMELLRTDFGGNSLRYIRTGKPDAKIALLWIHGAPGSLDMFMNALSDSILQANFRMYSLDRLGYGGSRNGQSFPSIKEQAKSINHVLEKVEQEEIWLFAHSFGVAIAGKVAHTNPRVRQIFLAGGAVDPELEKFEPLAKVVNTRLLRSLSSHDTRSATDEKLSHRSELRKIASIWSELQCKVVAIHGTKDWLVPYENQDFLRERIAPELFTDKTLEGKSHFFFTDGDLLRDLVMEVYQK